MSLFHSDPKWFWYFIHLSTEHWFKVFLQKQRNTLSLKETTWLFVSGKNSYSVLGTKATFCGRLSETGFGQFNIWGSKPQFNLAIYIKQLCFHGMRTHKLLKPFPSQMVLLRPNTCHQERGGNLWHIPKQVFMSLCGFSVRMNRVSEAANIELCSSSWEIKLWSCSWIHSFPTNQLKKYIYISRTFARVLSVKLKCAKTCFTLQDLLFLSWSITVWHMF